MKEFSVITRKLRMTKYYDKATDKTLRFCHNLLEASCLSKYDITKLEKLGIHNYKVTCYELILSIFNDVGKILYYGSKLKAKQLLYTMFIRRMEELVMILKEGNVKPTFCQNLCSIRFSDTTYLLYDNHSLSRIISYEKAMSDFNASIYNHMLDEDEKVKRDRKANIEIEAWRESDEQE